MKNIPPKEQAEDLISKMHLFIPLREDNVKSSLISAKYCAITMVRGIIAELNSIHKKKYWKEVLQELENYQIN